MENFGLYLVMTNPAVGYVRCCEAAVKAGVGIVQLRMKDAPRADVVAVARELRKVTLGSDTLLIVNDDPAAAAEAGADGVHVGQTDMPVAEACAADIFALPMHPYLKAEDIDRICGVIADTVKA